MANRSVPAGAPLPEDNPRNYSPLGGTSRRFAYLGDPNTTISLRHYQRLQNTYGGNKAQRAIHSTAPRIGYRANITKYQNAQAAKGNTLTRQQIRQDPQFKKALRMLAEAEKEHQDYILDASKPDPLRAGGALARGLEELGVREPNATYKVGETKKKGKK